MGPCSKMLVSEALAWYERFVLDALIIPTFKTFNSIERSILRAGTSLGVEIVMMWVPFTRHFQKGAGTTVK